MCSRCGSDSRPCRHAAAEDRLGFVTDYIYEQSGSAVGYIRGRFIHDMSGSVVGQLTGTHVHKLSGQYVGELEDSMILDKRLGNLGNIGNPGNPGNAGNPGNPGNHGNRATQVSRTCLASYPASSRTRRNPLRPERSTSLLSTDAGLESLLYAPPTTAAISARSIFAMLMANSASR